jgi:hypothetical protein
MLLSTSTLSTAARIRNKKARRPRIRVAAMSASGTSGAGLDQSDVCALYVDLKAWGDISTLAGTIEAKNGLSGLYPPVTNSDRNPIRIHGAAAIGTSLSPQP